MPERPLKSFMKCLAYLKESRAIRLVIFPVFFIYFLCCNNIYGLKPSEILIIANKNSLESLKLARYYQEKRHIPKDNIISLNCPFSEEISRSDFNKKIARPLKGALLMPGWAVNIKCLLLTYGIPLKIRPIKFNKKKTLELQKLKERKKVIKNLLKNKKITKKEQNRLNQELKKLERKIFMLDPVNTRASVDSELTLIKVYGDYELQSWMKNPLFIKNNGLYASTIPPNKVLMVSRIDGPNLKVSKRIIEDAIYAEGKGLKGLVCIDSRYKKIPEKGNIDFYHIYDKWLKDTGAYLKKKGFSVKLDKTPKLFGPGSCNNTAIYCGWYSLSHFIDGFTWVKGAIGYHVASGECVSLHGKNDEWCRNLLMDGVSVTLGPVAEPYLQAFPPPQLFFGLLVEKGVSIAEAYILSCPFLSWQMILIGDPLYRPFRAETLKN